MPTPAAVGDCFEVRVRGTQEGQETNNVLHFACVGQTADLETHLILALAECFITHLLPVITSSYSLTDIRWKQVYPVLGPEFITTPVGFGAGAGAAAALPSYCAVVVSKRTVLGGRSRRGRLYLAGIPEAATINSQLDPAHAFWNGVIAFVACCAEKFIATGEPIGNDAFRLQVYSRKIGGDTYPLGQTGFQYVSQLVATTALGTMRSRKVGIGS